jgi:hypothetical protein
MIFFHPVHLVHPVKMSWEFPAFQIPAFGVISLRHETKADGTPISESARLRFQQRNQNDQKTNLTRIISRSLGCCFPAPEFYFYSLTPEEIKIVEESSKS